MAISKVPIDVQIKAFKKHRTELFDGNRVRPSSAEIFKTLSQKLGMSAQAIRLSVERKTVEILGILMQSRAESASLHAIIKKSTESESAGADEGTSQLRSDESWSVPADNSVEIGKNDESNEAISNFPHNDSAENVDTHDKSIDSSVEVGDADDVNPLEVKGKLISFQVNIESKNIFGVQKKTQGKKDRFKAASGWSFKLRKIIWENFKSPCCWIFKSADPKLNGDLKCKGNCKPCGATIMVHVAGECMNVEISNYDASKSHPRKKKRHIMQIWFEVPRRIRYIQVKRTE